MTLLATVTQLRTLLRLTSMNEDTHEYATMMLAQASTAVRDAARRPEWTIQDPPPSGQILAPQGARDITLWVAHRAYTNPKNLARRGVGPISEAFQDSGVYGVELTETERARLVELGGRARRGLWVQPIATGSEGTMLTTPSDMPIPGDPFYIADVGQFPYGHNSPGPAPVEYDGVTGV